MKNAIYLIIFLAILLWPAIMAAAGKGSNEIGGKIDKKDKTGNKVLDAIIRFFAAIVAMLVLGVWPLWFFGAVFLTGVIMFIFS